MPIFPWGAATIDHGCVTSPGDTLIRVRRNCTHEDDFITQSQVLVSRFEQIGYVRQSLEGEIAKVKTMDRQTLVSDRIKVFNSDDHNFKMILVYKGSV